MNELKNMRLKMGLTQEQMAARVGLSWGTYYSAMENGTAPVSKERMLLIKAAFIRDTMGVLEGQKAMWELFE